MSELKAVCVVTPDIVGPVRNGGIGTHAFNLANLLVAEGRQVDVIYTGPWETGDAQKWKAWYAERGIGFLPLEDLPQPQAPLRLDPVLLKSWRVYQHLLRSDYESAHFQDWYANGFHSIQAKRTLGVLDQTCLTVTLHSSTQWIAEGAQRPYVRPIEDRLIAWCERYAAQHADIVVSPSQYMFDWARSAGWQLAERQAVLPNILPSAVGPKDKDAPATRPAKPVIAFFGRLETRKGLLPFLDALDLIKDTALGGIGELVFLGKDGDTDFGPASKLIKRRLADLAVDWQIRTDLDTFAAQSLLIQTGAVAFVPSLAENHPFAVLECCARGIPVLGARIGGIPEILPDSALFEPTPRGIAAALTAVATGAWTRDPTLYDPESARAGWVGFVANDCREIAAAKPDPRKVTTELPLISVCVPYYNYGRYVRQMLDSLVAQDMQDFEVILINDGSTQAESVDVFNALAKDYPAPQFRFYSHDNQGVGATRNAAAAHARAPYLLFMDSDNVAKPDMLSTFLAAIEQTNVDIVTCHYDIFLSEEAPLADETPIQTYAPFGQCVEMSWHDNYMGDANMIVRRSAFEAMGGFGTERDSSWEDLEFLITAALSGRTQDTVPAALFWYRNQEEGFSRNTSLWKNRRRIQSAYVKASPPPVQATLMALFSVAEARPHTTFEPIQHFSRLLEGTPLHKPARSFYLLIKSIAGR